MLSANKVLTKEEYEDLRWEVIKRLEGVKSLPYIADEGIAVIGVGFNIEENPTLRDLRNTPKAKTVAATHIPF